MPRSRHLWTPQPRASPTPCPCITNANNPEQCTRPPPANPDRLVRNTGVVVKVVDGDTVDVLILPLRAEGPLPATRHHTPEVHATPSGACRVDGHGEAGADQTHVSLLSERTRSARRRYGRLPRSVTEPSNESDAADPKTRPLDPASPTERNPTPQPSPTPLSVPPDFRELPSATHLLHLG